MADSMKCQPIRYQLYPDAISCDFRIAYQDNIAPCKILFPMRYSYEQQMHACKIFAIKVCKFLVVSRIYITIWKI